MTDGKAAGHEGKRADHVDIVGWLRSDRPRQRRCSVRDGELPKDRSRPEQACVVDIFCGEVWLEDRSKL